MPRWDRSIRRGCRGSAPDGKLISGDAPTKEVPLHSALYQTRSAARAVVHLHSTHSVALSMLPEIDPRAALPPMTPYYLMKCGATALVPYYRPGDPAVADAIKGLAGKYSSVLLANHGPVVSGDTLEAAVYAIEELEETAKLYLLLRGLNPRYLTPAAGGGFIEDVRAGVAGAWAAHTAVILRCEPSSASLEGWLQVHAAHPSRRAPDSASALPESAHLRMTWHVRKVVKAHNPKYALRTSGLPLMSAAVPCIRTRPVCRM